MYFRKHSQLTHSNHKVKSLYVVSHGGYSVFTMDVSLKQIICTLL